MDEGLRTIQCHRVSVGKLSTSPSCNSRSASYSDIAIVSGPRHPQVPWNLSSGSWWIPVPTPTPICTDGYEEMFDPLFYATDCSIASRSATSAAIKDIMTLVVEVQRFRMSFVQQVNFKSSCSCLCASASVSLASVASISWALALRASGVRSLPFPLDGIASPTVQCLLLSLQR